MNMKVLSFQVYLPESLGLIYNPYAHVRINMRKKWIELKPIPAGHVSRYQSLCGQEWLRIFKDGKEIFEYDEKLKTSVFYFSVKVLRDEPINGEFFLTFDCWKKENLTSYYTETKHFKVTHKFICE